jgi:limonene 1,2-monooxygenase
MVARYVIPEINGYVESLRRSQKHVIENRESFERAGQAVMAKIMENEKAAAALAVTRTNRFAVSGSNAPNLKDAATKAAKK